MKIHPTAIVDPGAELAEDVEIGPFCIVHRDTRLERGGVLDSHVVIYPYATLGEGTRVYATAVLGGDPQSLPLDPEMRSYVRIGARCLIREAVTVHRAMHEGGVTVVGDDCFLMANCHIAHDCKIGDHVIISSFVGMAGHCEVGDRAVLGGMVGIHQFVRIGTLAMIGGVTRVSTDCPPYIITAGVPSKHYGVNDVGLKRNGVPDESRRALKKAFRLLFRGQVSRTEAVERVRAEVPPCPEVHHLLEFLSQVSEGDKGRALST